jgi:SET domain-containing protein
LFSRKKIQAGELVIPYLGLLHHTLIPVDGSAEGRDAGNEEDESDYDLSLLRLSHADPRNPFPGYHISIGVDAASQGNAARFVNDYRGVGTAPNAEFRLDKGEGGELRMEIWSLKQGISKGEEILVSYGKSWWGARQ